MQIVELPDPVADEVTHVNGVDIDAIIDGARRARRSMDLCLRGDLVAEYEDLDRQREEAQKIDLGDSLASGGTTADIVTRMDALRAEMKAGSITVVLEALTRRNFLKLCSLHPVRRDEEGKPEPRDIGLGVNVETVWDPLIRACWVSPTITKARLTRVLDEILSDAQYSALAGLAWEVNRADVDIPFSYAASRNRQHSSPE
jgi:hypothetical protein